MLFSSSTSSQTSDMQTSKKLATSEGYLKTFVSVNMCDIFHVIHKRMHIYFKSYIISIHL